ncbi:hypothetical protein MOMA_01110 [Moraxella macacae 0408225]|uniref:Uncharacterized protein n=1 Tax=Moraxella macacae 0408225 TaxID=1230338 RepID=L2F7S2_9GAMM|nr:hypothetical protein [Moraxella macacae]ELA08965.1 hypothetical protein MOMA_01110 [Moraxella macacae 0408225]
MKKLASVLIGISLLSTIGLSTSSFANSYSRYPAPTLTLEQKQIIEKLTNDSVTMIDAGAIYSLFMKDMVAKLQLNNPQLSYCLDDKFSKTSYFNFKKQEVTRYVLSNDISKVRNDIKILSPELVYAVGNVVSLGVSRKTGLNTQNNPNEFISDETKNKFGQLLFDFRYQNLRNAVLFPTKISRNDTSELLSLKGEGAGYELGLKYMAWAYKQCGL